MTTIELESILFRAVQSEWGIAVSTSDPEGFKRVAYAHRVKARAEGVTAFDKLSFRTSPTAASTEVWITKEQSAHAS